MNFNLAIMVRESPASTLDAPLLHLLKSDEIAYLLDDSDSRPVMANDFPATRIGPVTEKLPEATDGENVIAGQE